MKLQFVSANPKAYETFEALICPPWKAVFWKATSFGNPFRRGWHFVLEIVITFFRLIISLEMYKKEGVIVCTDNHISVLAFGKWLRFWGIRKRIYILSWILYNAYNNEVVQKILGFLLDQDVGIMAFSGSDRDYYMMLGKKADVRSVPWCGDDPGFEIDPSQIKDGDYIFSGGHANRDYDLLIRSARKFPELRFVIVCSRDNSITEEIPANVHISKNISSKEFHALMAGSLATIIPLKANVGSSGQMAAVAAMKFGKATIYPDYDVVSQYFDNGVNGLMYNANSLDSLSSAVSLILADPVRRCRIGLEARKKWKTNFTPDIFLRAICDHMADFLGVAFKQIGLHDGS